MDLVLINQYFPPDDAPTGLMLEAVALELAAAGHRVTVLSSRGGYAGAASAGAATLTASESPGDGITIRRVGATSFGRGSALGKLCDYLSFYAGVTWHLLAGERADRIVALTTPPFLSLLARFAGKLRGADHAHWVMDLYPDVMNAHGMLRAGHPAYKMLQWLARAGFGGKRCAACVTLGPDMAERVGHYMNGGSTGVEWVPLWGSNDEALVSPESEALLETKARELRTQRGWQEGETVFMYSGNMGLGHCFTDFLEVARTHDRATGAARFAFFGGGRRRGEIESFVSEHADAPVELQPYVARQQLGEHLRSADVHLASLEPAWDGTMVPSKLQGIFAAGRPVIFVGSARSSIGRWIAESGGGWVAAPGDVAALRKALAAALDPAERMRRGELAREYARDHFQKAANARRTAGCFTAQLEPRKH